MRLSFVHHGPSDSSRLSIHVSAASGKPKNLTEILANIPDVPSEMDDEMWIGAARCFIAVTDLSEIAADPRNRLALRNVVNFAGILAEVSFSAMSSHFRTDGPISGLEYLLV